MKRELRKELKVAFIVILIAGMLMCINDDNSTIFPNLLGVCLSVPSAYVLVRWGGIWQR